MVWARLDDEILDNDKIVRAGILGFALHVAAVTWCCRNLTDGYVPRRRALTLLDMGALSEEYVEAIGSHPQGVIDHLHEAMFEVRAPTAEPAIERLVACGLWRYDDARDGYWLKDFLIYNPSKAKVMAERARGNERKKSSRHVGLSHAESARDTPRNPGMTRSGVRTKSHADSGPVSDGPVPDPVPDLSSKDPPLPPVADDGPEEPKEDPPPQTSDDRYAEAYAQGQRDVSKAPYPAPVEPWERGAIARFTQTAGWGFGLQGQELLDAIQAWSRDYRRARDAQSQYERGFPPKRCEEWARGQGWKYRPPKAPPSRQDAPQSISGPKTTTGPVLGLDASKAALEAAVAAIGKGAA